MHSWTPQELLECFEQGLRIDISPFYDVKNSMCHTDYAIQFIPKSQKSRKVCPMTIVKIDNDVHGRA
jgi:hypothetical protein